MKTHNITFDECIADLTPDFIEILREMDTYLKSLKLRRRINGDCSQSKITYFLSKIISYKIRISGDFIKMHSISPLLSGFGNKNINRENLFEKLEKESPAFAEKLFLIINECRGCDGDAGCVYKHLIEYKGKNKMSCCHDIWFKVTSSDFEDVKKLIATINELAKAVDINK